MGFLMRVVASGVAIWVAALIVPGVELAEGDLGDRLLTVLLVAVIFGLVNAVIRPIVSVITLPLTVLTLGLFTLVINALLFWLTAWIAGELGLAFTVDGFVAALLGALVVSIVSLLFNRVTKR